eukprot:11125773-Alexandrium_andersonii.AAC.1
MRCGSGATVAAMFIRSFESSPYHHQPVSQTVSRSVGQSVSQPVSESVSADVVLGSPRARQARSKRSVLPAWCSM